MEIDPTTWITDEVRDYQAGKINFDVLAHRLASATYPDLVTVPTGSIWDGGLIDDVQDRCQMGTWQEVIHCRDIGLLTPDEYLAICRLADQSHPRTTPAKTA